MRALDRKKFYSNSQQDVPEILQIVIDELIGSSSLADDLLSVTLTVTTSCNLCFYFSSRKQKNPSVSDSFNEVFQSQQLKGDNKWFCPQCSLLREDTVDTQILNCGSVLIVQLLRYTVNGSSYKYNRLIECLPEKHHVKSAIPPN